MKKHIAFTIVLVALNLNALVDLANGFGNQDAGGAFVIFILSFIFYLAWLSSFCVFSNFYNLADDSLFVKSTKNNLKNTFFGLVGSAMLCFLLIGFLAAPLVVIVSALNLIAAMIGHQKELRSKRIAGKGDGLG